MKSTKKRVHVLMKITPEISALVEKIDMFKNLRHVIVFWIYSGVSKQSEWCRNRAVCKKSTFSEVFLKTLKENRNAKTS